MVDARSAARIRARAPLATFGVAILLALCALAVYVGASAPRIVTGDTQAGAGGIVPSEPAVGPMLRYATEYPTIP
jgi:hypothetical protein